MELVGVVEIPCQVARVWPTTPTDHIFRALLRGDLDGLHELRRENTATAAASLGGGLSVLHVAAALGAEEAVELLCKGLSQGASEPHWMGRQLGKRIDPLDGQHGAAASLRSIMDACNHDVPRGPGRMALCECVCPKAQLCLDLLRHVGNGATPLHLAVASGKMGAMQALLKAGK